MAAWYYLAMPRCRGAFGTVAAVVFLTGGVGACGSRNIVSGSGGAGGTVGAAGAAMVGTGGSGGVGGATAVGTGGTPVVGTGGAGGSVPEGCAGGATFEYLIRSLAALERTATGVASHGFDLDGRVSDGTMPEDCGLTDGVAPDGRAGIDNVVGGLWSEDFSALFNRSYTNGGAPMLLRLRGVDSFDQDDCVDIEWFGGSGAIPAALDAAGELAPGQRFRQTGVAGRIQKARIEDGRVVAAGEIPIRLASDYRDNTQERSFIFPITMLRIAFAARAEAVGGGELGGLIQPADVQAAYRSAYGSLISPEAVSSILYPDLPSTGSPCGLLSIGFGFDAVSATVIP